MAVFHPACSQSAAAKIELCMVKAGGASGNIHRMEMNPKEIRSNNRLEFISGA